MRRRFVRFVSGLLVAAMVAGIPVVSMADTDGGMVDDYTIICHHTPTGDNIKEVKTVKPTCTTPGYTEYKCELCGYTFRDDYVSFTGHNYVGVTDKDGALVVDDEGYYTVKCQNDGCGRSFKVRDDESHDVSDLSDHTGTRVSVTYTANCKDYGYEKYTCSLEGGCKYEQYGGFVDPTSVEHTYSDWQIVKAPTETTYGDAKHTCSVCGDVETVKLDKETPSAKSGRVTKDLVPVYENMGDSEPAFLVAKGCTFDFANDYQEGTKWLKVTEFIANDGTKSSKGGYIQASNVEVNPGSVPIFTAFAGLKYVGTVTTTSNLIVRKGPTDTSASIRTVSKGDTLYIYKLDSAGDWGRISPDTNEWVELNYVDLVGVFGTGADLPDLEDETPEAKELLEVGTVTAKAAAVVREDHDVSATSVGTLPKGTKINFYKSTETDKPYFKNTKNVPVWGFIDKDEADRLGLSDEGWIDLSYVSLKSVPGSGSAGGSTSSGDSVIATGTVTSAINLNVRKEPEVSVLNLMGSVPTGTKLEFYQIGDANGASWGKIKYNGSYGWVCMTYVQLDAGSSSGSTGTTATPNATVVNCSIAVNVRDAASVSGKLLSTIPVNSRIAVTKLGDRWCFVDGKGWVCMDYVKLDAGAEDAINNANSSKPSDSNTGSVKTYTNVTVPATANADLAVYPTTVEKTGGKLLTIVSGKSFVITDRTIVNNELWYKVTVGDVTGWVKAGVNSANVTLPAITGTVSATTLNVYEKRSVDSEVKYTLGNGTKVTIVEGGQWTDGVYVWGTLNTGVYVQMNYLSLNVETASGAVGSSVGNMPISARIANPVMVTEKPGSGDDLVQLEKGYTITIKTWAYVGGKTYGKVTVGEDTGWVEISSAYMVQDDVSAKVSADVVALYEKPAEDKTTLTLRSGNTVTVKERLLVGNAPWGKIVAKNGTTEGVYWINLSGTTLGTYSIDPTTPADTNSGSGSTGNTGNTGNSGSTGGSVSTGTATGSICNTDKVNVRTAPGVRNTLATTLDRGTPVTVYEQKTVDDALWGRIDQGWVAMTYVDLSSKGNTGNSTVSSGAIGGNTILTSVPSGAVAVGFVNIADLTVRNGAGLGYTKTGTLAKNTNVVIYEQILKEGMIWGRCDKGWICTSYVTITGTSVTGSGTAGTVARCFYTANVRSAPGVGNALVGKIMVNSRIEIYEQQSYSGEMWGRTSIGWIAMQYVLTDGSLPVA